MSTTIRRTTDSDSPVYSLLSGIDSPPVTKPQPELSIRQTITKNAKKDENGSQYRYETMVSVTMQGEDMTRLESLLITLTTLADRTARAETKRRQLEDESPEASTVDDHPF